MTVEIQHPLELQLLRRLKLASYAEATTLVLLTCVAVPLKHLAGWDTGVHVMGPVHGFSFLLYAWMAVQAVTAGNWTGNQAARLFAAAFIPFGGFTNIPLIRRKAAGLRMQEENRWA